MQIVGTIKEFPKRCHRDCHLPWVQFADQIRNFQIF